MKFPSSGRIRFFGLCLVQLFFVVLGDHIAHAASGQKSALMDRHAVRSFDEPDTVLERIGLSYFMPARQRILGMEKRLQDGGSGSAMMAKGDAAGYVGPLDMVSGNMTSGMPERYYLSPGDRVLVSYWGIDQELTNLDVIVNDAGEVEISQIGRFVARGMTLDQFEETVYDLFLRATSIADFQLVASLERLKSIQIQVRGHAFRPGSYAVSSVTTLLNALYACGGPDDSGSLRSIRLIRGDRVYEVDFYRYLMQNSGDGDRALQGGDILFIPETGRMVGIEGEVKVPAFYELTSQEGLEDVISYAGGLKPTALVDNIRIRTVQPGRERLIRNIDLSQIKDFSSVALLDGDRIMVPEVSKDVLNFVSISGNVKYPGKYELQRGMRLKDLLEKTRLLEDSYRDRAVVIRYNFTDATYDRLQVNLEKLLEGNSSENIGLQELDQVRVFAREEAAFGLEKKVVVSGAVQRPGTYIRSEGMRLSDLLFESGGLKPDYYPYASLARALSENQTELVEIDLDALREGRGSENYVLHDGDVLSIRNKTDFYFEPRSVVVEGEVKFPGSYVLKNKEVQLREVLEMAGGFTASAYPKGLVLKREREFLHDRDMEGQLRKTHDTATEVLRQQFRQTRAKNRAQLARLYMDNTCCDGVPSVTDGSSSIEKSMAASLIPKISNQTAKAGGSIIESIGASNWEVTSVRELTDDKVAFRDRERVLLDIDRVLKGKVNVVLMPGDEIYIPAIKNSVSVVGAVSSSPLTMAYRPHSDVDFFVDRAGGYDEDAHEDMVKVVRVDGTVMLADDVHHIEPGDVIYVPTRVMSLDVKSSTDKILDVAKYTVTSALSVLVFMTLAGGL